MKAKTESIKSEFKVLNPEKKPLTKEKLKEMSGLHDLTDEEAEEMVQSIHSFAKLLYELMRQQSSDHESKKTINMTFQQQAA